MQDLGEPDFAIAGLKVWIHGRQFPDATDYWDGNWLLVTISCTYPSSSVTAGGPILHLSEVATFKKSCEELYQKLKGRAVLDCMEPNLRVGLLAEGHGRIQVAISITPNHLTESHEFRDEVDQTFLPPIIAGCERILKKFPIRAPSESKP
jgi:hypothetical protein